MERIRIYLITLVFLLGIQNAGFCETYGITRQGAVTSSYTAPSLSTLVTPQNVPFEECTRVFNINSNNLFYLTIAAINANRFEIRELQAKTGYILFAAVGKEFLASAIVIDKSHSMLKITPANNNYFFAPGIVLNVFKYIDLNAGEDLQNIPRTY